MWQSPRGYRLYRCSLFSRDTPKFDPYPLVSGVRNHLLHGQHPSGGNLWNKTVPYVYVIAKTTLSLDGHPKTCHPFLPSFQISGVLHYLSNWLVIGYVVYRSIWKVISINIVNFPSKMDAIRSRKKQILSFRNEDTYFVYDNITCRGSDYLSVLHSGSGLRSSRPQRA